ncbi:MAG: hypothetical protein B6240_02975 [Desulfobacteraceae bacterium 4572_87]|nr:MAG: hypothetical protein B6240_02975 [Desulfobacteraceae bacterium 4572_87]
MKKTALLLLMLLMFPVVSNAEDFLSAPVVSQGKENLRTDARLEMKSSLSHDEVVLFYREKLKGLPNIKFRDWEDATYIEDDGARPWHSITISKNEKDGADIVIVKDNWTWIIGTLVLRYIGVFVVLMIVFVGMTVSGKIITSFVSRSDAKKAAG